MHQYQELLAELIVAGNEKGDRTGTGTRSKFGHQMRFDLREGFPLVTTKKINFNAVAHELLWFLKGDTNIKYLNDNGVNIWNEWADENGDLGPVYGAQWRSWRSWRCDKWTTKDQIAEVIEQIKTNPNSRWLIVTAWNPADVDRMALPPCHCLFQFYVHDGKLSCRLDQRSADTYLGVPYNLASYALLTHMIADQCGLEAGDLVWQGGDVHLYDNHLTQAYEQLKREPYPLPTLHLAEDVESIDDYKIEDIKLINYFSHPHIKASVAV